MKRILTAIVLIPLVLLVLFKAPLWLFTLVVGVVAMGAAWEYLGLVDGYGIESMKTPTMGLFALVFGFLTIGDFISGSNELLLCIIAVLAFPFVLLIFAFFSQDISQALPRAALSAFAIPYLLLTLLCLPVIRVSPAGTFLLLFTCIVVWSGDIFAYYAGRAFGKHKLAPRISPGKTWEGTLASFVGSVFLAHILFVDNRQIMDALYRWHLVSTSAVLPIIERSERLLQGLILGGCVNIAAQIGDLVESLMKRGAGVKDSGHLLPGHGGILDRIDALLFALPVVCLYAIISTPLYT